MARIRPATRPDAERIVEIFRGSLSSTILPRLMLGYPGAASYIQDVIRSQQPGSNHSLVVSCDGGQVAGAAEFRRIDKKLFLNQIGVDPAMRGKGIGRELLARGLLAARRDPDHDWMLDVFLDNVRARDWYASLEMDELEQRIWLDVSPPLAGQQRYGSAETTGLVEADLEHAEHGFSRFALRTEAGNYDIGRLGKKFFRCTSLGILNDPPALGALCAIDSKRALVCVGPANDLPKTASLPYRVVGHSVRLAGSIGTSVAILQQRMARTRGTRPAA
jgi:ribosomal protein S18 acetylase RimI-like enzyme